jgi:hypothetical protein
MSMHVVRHEQIRAWMTIFSKGMAFQWSCPNLNRNVGNIYKIYCPKSYPKVIEHIV